jgi:hypothetical protein
MTKISNHDIHSYNRNNYNPVLISQGPQVHPKVHIIIQKIHSPQRMEATNNFRHLKPATFREGAAALNDSLDLLVYVRETRKRVVTCDFTMDSSIDLWPV